MSLALIDGDVIVYQAGYMSQETKVRENGEKYLAVEPLSHACFLAKLIINSILTEVGADDYKLFLTTNESTGPKANFRVELATSVPYKGNRMWRFRDDKNQLYYLKGVKTIIAAKEYCHKHNLDFDKGKLLIPPPKPHHYEALREYMVKHWKAQVIVGCEADDAMAMHQYKNYVVTKQRNSVICSIDKDLNIVPGWHYNWKRKERFLVNKLGTLTLEDNKLFGTGLKFFYVQLLTGDSADNIPGLDKVGPKTAYKLLNPCKNEEEMLSLVIEQYRKNNKSLAYFNEQCDLLWMRQTKEFKSEELLKCYSEKLSSLSAR